jgi:hypothetical protein
MPWAAKKASARLTKRVTVVALPSGWISVKASREWSSMIEWQNSQPTPALRSWPER